MRGTAAIFEDAVNILGKTSMAARRLRVGYASLKSAAGGGGSWQKQTINAHVELRTLITYARDTALLIAAVTSLVQDGELPATTRAALGRRVPRFSPKTRAAAMLVVLELDAVDQSPAITTRRTVGHAGRPPLPLPSIAGVSSSAGAAAGAAAGSGNDGESAGGGSAGYTRGTPARAPVVASAPHARQAHSQLASGAAAVVSPPSDQVSGATLDGALRRLIGAIFHEQYDPRRAKAGGEDKQACDLELVMPFYSLVYTNESVEAPGSVACDAVPGGGQRGSGATGRADGSASGGTGGDNDHTRAASSGGQGSSARGADGPPPTYMSAEHASHAYASFLFATHAASVDRVINQPTPEGHADSWLYVDEVTNTEGCTAAAHVTSMLSQFKIIARSEYQTVAFSPCEDPDHQLDGSICGTLPQRGLHMSTADVGGRVRQLQKMVWRVMTEQLLLGYDPTAGESGFLVGARALVDPPTARMVGRTFLEHPSNKHITRKWTLHFTRSNVLATSPLRPFECTDAETLLQPTPNPEAGEPARLAADQLFTARRSEADVWLRRYREVAAALWSLQHVTADAPERLTESRETLICDTLEKRRTLFWEAGLGTFVIVSGEWKGSTASGGVARQAFRRLHAATSTMTLTFLALVEPMERGVVRSVRQDMRRRGEVPLGGTVRPAHLLFRDEAGRPLSPFFLSSRLKTHLADGHGVADYRHFAVGVIRVLTGWDVDSGPLSSADGFSDRAHAAGPLAAAADSQSKHRSATAAIVYATDASSAIPGLSAPLRELHGVVSATLQRAMGLAWRQPRGRMMHPTRDAAIGVASSPALTGGASPDEVVDAMMELLPPQRAKRCRAAPDGASAAAGGDARRALAALTAAAVTTPVAAGDAFSAAASGFGQVGSGGGGPAAAAVVAPARARKRPRGGKLGRWSPQPSSLPTALHASSRGGVGGSRSPAAVVAHVHGRVRRLTPVTTGPLLDRLVRWLHGDAIWRSPLQREAALVTACATDPVTIFVVMPTGSGKTHVALLPALLEQKAAVMAAASDLFADDTDIQDAAGKRVLVVHPRCAVGSASAARSETPSPPPTPSPSDSPTTAAGVAASAAQMAQVPALLPPTTIVVTSTRAVTRNWLAAARRLDITAAYWSPATASGVTVDVVDVGVVFRQCAAFRLWVSTRDAHGRLARLFIDEAHQIPLWSNFRQDNAGLAQALAGFPAPVILLSGTIPPALEPCLRSWVGCDATRPCAVLRGATTRRADLRYLIEEGPSKELLCGGSGGGRDGRQERVGGVTAPNWRDAAVRQRLHSAFAGRVCTRATELRTAAGSVRGRSGLVGVFCQTLEAVEAVADEIKALLELVDGAAADITVLRYTSESLDRETVLDAMTSSEPRAGILVAVGTPGLATRTDCAGMALSFHLGGRHLLDFLQASGRTNREGATIWVPGGPPVTTVGEVIVWNPPGYSTLLSFTPASQAAGAARRADARGAARVGDNDGDVTVGGDRVVLPSLPPPDAPGVAHVGDFDKFTSMHSRIVGRCRRKDLEATADGVNSDLVLSCSSAHFPLCDVCSESASRSFIAGSGDALDGPPSGHPPPPPGSHDGEGGGAPAGSSSAFAASSTDAGARAAAEVVLQRWAVQGVRYVPDAVAAVATPPVVLSPISSAASTPADAAAAAAAAAAARREAAAVGEAAPVSIDGVSRRKRKAPDVGGAPTHVGAILAPALSTALFWSDRADLGSPAPKVARLLLPEAQGSVAAAAALSSSTPTFSTPGGAPSHGRKRGAGQNGDGSSNGGGTGHHRALISGGSMARRLPASTSSSPAQRHFSQGQQPLSTAESGAGRTQLLDVAIGVHARPLVSSRQGTTFVRMPAGLPPADAAALSAAMIVLPRCLSAARALRAVGDGGDGVTCESCRATVVGTLTPGASHSPGKCCRGLCVRCMKADSLDHPSVPLARRQRVVKVTGECRRARGRAAGHSSGGSQPSGTGGVGGHVFPGGTSVGAASILPYSWCCGWARPGSLCFACFLPRSVQFGEAGKLSLHGDGFEPRFCPWGTAIRVAVLQVNIVRLGAAADVDVRAPGSWEATMREVLGFSWSAAPVDMLHDDAQHLSSDQAPPEAHVDPIVVRYPPASILWAADGDVDAFARWLVAGAGLPNIFFFAPVVARALRVSPDGAGL